MSAAPGSFGPLPFGIAEVHGMVCAGASCNEIAEALDISPSTARQRAMQARRHLRGLERAHTPAQYERLSAFEMGDLTPCVRCGLRGPHECLPARASDMLGRREDSDCVRHTPGRR